MHIPTSYKKSSFSFTVNGKSFTIDNIDCSSKDSFVNIIQKYPEPLSYHEAKLVKNAFNQNPFFIQENIEEIIIDEEIHSMMNKLYKYALNNYNNDGWDYFVEAFEVKEIHETFLKKNFKEFKDAFSYYQNILKTMNSIREDIQNA